MWFNFYGIIKKYKLYIYGNILDINCNNIFNYLNLL